MAAQERTLPKSASSDVKESEEKTVRRLAKSKGIHSTRALVEAHNTTTDAKEKALFRRWLDRYHEVLAGKAGQGVAPDVVREYAELSRTKIPYTAQRECQIFHQKVLSTFAAILSPEDAQNANTNAYAKAIGQAQNNVAHYILEEAPFELHDLAHKLIQCIPAELRITNKEFQWNGDIFHTLHSTLELLYSSCRSEEVDPTKFHNGIILREKCEEIKNSDNCYRSWYYMKIVEQDIRRINNMRFFPRKKTWCTIVGDVVLGPFYCFQGFRRALDIETDTAASARRVRRVNSADDPETIQEEAWYWPTQRLVNYTSKALEEDIDLSYYQAGYVIAIKFLEGCQNEEDRKAFQFGHIGVLSHLAHESETVEVREDSVTKLLDMSKEAIIKDSDIFEIFLEAVHTSCRLEEHRKRIGEKLQSLFNEMTDEDPRTKQIDKWLDGKTLEEKLSSHQQQSDDTGDCLFREVGKKVGLVLTVQDMDDNIEGLKSRYKDKSFSEVAFSHARHEQKRRVKKMEYSTMIPKRAADGEANVVHDTNAEDTDEHHTTFNHLTQYPTGESVRLGDLFRDRVLDPDAEPSEVKSVLLIGIPGAGKTCLTKTIACQWAHGNRWREFETVYIISIKKLTGGEIFNPSEYWGTRNLERVIAKLMFNSEDSHSNPLLTQIQDTLESPKTLLIFDGLEERNTLAKHLLSSAFRRSCKLLLTSRPCNLHEVQHQVDLTVECPGFNDLQFLRFIYSEIGNDGPRLVKLLYPNPSLWEPAHVPVIANILCLLWKDPKQVPRKNELTKSLWNLYDMVARHMWKHFAESSEKLRSKPPPGIFDVLSEIAFATLKDGNSLVQKKDIDKASKSMEEWILANCGFLVKQMGSKDYRFLHPVFQEFFAGRYLAKAFKNPGADSGRYNRVKEFLTEGKYLQRQRNAIRFMTEEFFQDRDYHQFPALIEHIDRAPVLDVTGIQHLFTKLQVLNAVLSSLDPSLIDALKENEIVNSLLESLRSLIANHYKNADMREVLSSQLGKISNVLDAFPDLVASITKTEGHDTLLFDASFQYLIQIIARIPGYREWVAETLKKQAMHADEAGARAMENTARVLVASSGELVEDLTRILENGCRGEIRVVRQVAAPRLRTIIGKDANKMESQLELLERERRILTGDIPSEVIEQGNDAESTVPESMEDIIAHIIVSPETDDRLRRALRTADLTMLTNVFWSRQSDCVLREIALRSMRTAMTISAERRWTRKRTLFLHGNKTSRTVCEQSNEDIKQLLSKIHGVLEQMYPGLLQIAELKKHKDRVL